MSAFRMFEYAARLEYPPWLNMSSPGVETNRASDPHSPSRDSGTRRLLHLMLICVHHCCRRFSRESFRPHSLPRAFSPRHQRPRRRCRTSTVSVTECRPSARSSRRTRTAAAARPTARAKRGSPTLHIVRHTIAKTNGLRAYREIRYLYCGAAAMTNTLVTVNRQSRVGSPVGKGTGLARHDTRRARQRALAEWSIRDSVETISSTKNPRHQQLEICCVLY